MTERKGWTQNSPYEFVYPGGWSITNRIINGKSRWTLLCAGEQFGAFSSAAAAMNHHAALMKKQDGGA
ncbi:hypothetical protein [Paraburkholderia sp. MM5477-R1]|uniref:hypothetical protein n=1 Tax=Paraburkholderia sp. MM5477-R1 TaxID=2991062 RepID=UPI003D1A256B